MNWLARINRAKETAAMVIFLIIKAKCRLTDGEEDCRQVSPIYTSLLNDYCRLF